VLTDYKSQLIDFHEQKLMSKVYRDFTRTSINMFEQNDIEVRNFLKSKNKHVYDEGYQLKPQFGPS